MNCIQCSKEIQGTRILKSGLCYSCKASNEWAKKERTIISRICIECGAEFKKQRSSCVERVKIVKGVPYKYKSGLFCSRECTRINISRRFSNGKHPTIGKTWRHTEEYKKRLSEARKGKKNPAYKHGAYSGKARRGVQQPQKEWRNLIFKRDKYTCQICKIRNGNGKTTVLQAHHICPWGLFKKLRFNLANGVTLCSFCHKKIHDRYRQEKTLTKKSCHLILNEFLV